MIKVKTKACKKCGRELPANNDYFYAHPELKSGIDKTCRECRGRKFASDTKINVKAKKEGYHICLKCGKELPATKEYFHQRKNILHSRCKSCRNKDKRSWRINNINYVNDYNKRYREENQELIISGKKLYYLGNPEKKRIERKRYKSRKKSLPATLTTKQWENAKTYFGNKCCYCNKELPLEQEHFVPLSKGGEYTHNNIVPACRKCNASKSNKDFFAWYPKYKYYSQKRERNVLRFLGYDNNKTQQATLSL